VGKPKHLLDGRLGERVACRHLLRLGFDVLVRRYQGRSGEIDLIAFDAGILAFIEVKSRASRRFGEPFTYVDWEKKQKLRRTAEEFISAYDLGRYAYRFDIVSIVAPGTKNEQVELYKNAF
jgi:putative endonuclease